MADREYTPYQKKVIRRYYDNLPQAQIEQLGTLITDLYLNPTGKKADTAWKKIEKILRDQKVHPADIDYLLRTRNLEELSKMLGKLF